MSPHKIIKEHGSKITATGLVASIAGVVTLLTMVADLNTKLGTANNDRDGLRQVVEFQGQRLLAVERFTGIKRHGKAGPVLPPPQEGILRRVFRLIF
jgi:hypothetical protein